MADETGPIRIASKFQKVFVRWLDILLQIIKVGAQIDSRCVFRIKIEPRNRTEYHDEVRNPGLLTEEDRGIHIQDARFSIPDP